MVRRFPGVLLLGVVGTCVYGQGLSPATPAKEYIRSGGVVVAIENSNGSQDAQNRPERTPAHDFLLGSPFRASGLEAAFRGHKDDLKASWPSGFAYDLDFRPKVFEEAFNRRTATLRMGERFQ